MIDKKNKLCTSHYIFVVHDIALSNKRHSRYSIVYARIFTIRQQKCKCCSIQVCNDNKATLPVCLADHFLHKR